MVTSSTKVSKKSCASCKKTRLCIGWPHGVCASPTKTPGLKTRTFVFVRHNCGRSFLTAINIRDSIVVSISACHAEDPGSIPDRGICAGCGCPHCFPGCALLLTAPAAIMAGQKCLKPPRSRQEIDGWPMETQWLATTCKIVAKAKSHRLLIRFLVQCVVSTRKPSPP